MLFIEVVFAIYRNSFINGNHESLTVEQVEDEEKGGNGSKEALIIQYVSVPHYTESAL